MKRASVIGKTYDRKQQFKIRTSRDFELRDGLNWYIYANNNPLRFVDPTGLELLIYSESGTYQGVVPENMNPPIVSSFTVTVTATVVIDTETSKASVFAVTTNSVYETQPVTSITSARVNISDKPYAKELLERGNSTVLPSDKSDLGETEISLPPGFMEMDISFNTITSYMVKESGAAFFMKPQVIEIPVSFDKEENGSDGADVGAIDQAAVADAEEKGELPSWY